MKNLNNVLLLKLDDGIGMSMLIDSKIFESKKGIVSEIGHTVVEMNGRKCRCGKCGCLEAYFSLNALNTIYNERNNTNLSKKEYRELLDIKDDKALEPLLNNVKYLGMSLSNIVNIFNPELIIIDGYMSKYAKYYQQKLESYIKENTKNCVNILIHNYERNGTALGANITTVNQNLNEILFSFIKELK